MLDKALSVVEDAFLILGAVEVNEAEIVVVANLMLDVPLDTSKVEKLLTHDVLVDVNTLEHDV